MLYSIDMELKHIAIIMDGNRRWAKKRLLPSAAGHKEGAKALKRTVIACAEFGVKYLTVYAFSTENWNRKPEEVDFLMNLLASTIEGELDELHANNVVLNFLGDLSALSKDLQNILAAAVKKTRGNNGVHLQIAINYGARNEIVNAVKSIIEQGVKADKIDEKLVAEYLYTKNIPDPDLLIRTGGEKRISNFLLWQAAYSEIFVTKTHWPDFDKEALSAAIKEFSKRQRRFGG